MAIDFFKKSQGWFTKTVLLLLAAAFIFGFGYVGGISLGTGGTSGGTAVNINGEKVPLARFYLAQDNILRQFRGSDLPPEVRDFVKYRALQQIVEGKLLAQKADELGFRVSDLELSEAIRSNPSFQQDGKFVGVDNYKKIITKGFNLTVGQFEQSFKDELLVEKLVGMISESAKITDDELFNLYKTENERVSINYIKFTPSEYSNSVTLSDEEIKNYYDLNKNNLLTEEKRKVEYLKVSKDDLKENINISDTEVEAYYNSYKDEFLDESGGYKKLGDVKTEIVEELKNQRIGGAYSQFSEKYSSPIDGSINKIAAENGLSGIEEAEILLSGGSDLPDGVKNKVFSAEKGNVSAVNDGDTIWFVELIEVDTKREKTFEEAKQDIVKVLKVKKGKEAARIAAEETLKKVKGSGGFSNALSAGLKVEETGYFLRLKPPSEPKIDDLSIDAFLLTKDKPISDKVFESEDSYYILSLKDRSKIDENEFENKKEEIKQRELQKQRNELLSGWIRKLHEESKIIPNKQLFPTG